MSLNQAFKRTAEYLAFWSASVLLLAWHFAFGTELERIDVWFSVLFHASIGIVVALNAYLLIPSLLAVGKRGLYATGFVLVLCAGVYLNELTFDYLSGWLFPGYFFVSYLSLPEIGGYLLAYMLVTTLIQFSRSWFREADIRTELLQLKQHQQEQELQLLQQQVQPHFLFNSLNSIYALVRRQSEHAERAILVLSDLLRYTIEHAGRFSVPLHQEIEYIENYVTLQRFRYDNAQGITFEVRPEESDFSDVPGKSDFHGGSHLAGVEPVGGLVSEVGSAGPSSPEVDFNTQHNGTSWHIVPLLLINLVENAFKHGSPDEHGMRVRIQLQYTSERLLFTVENSVDSSEVVPVAGLDRSSDSHSGAVNQMRTGFDPKSNRGAGPGTGLDNVRKRLHFFYPNAHEIGFAESDSTFRVRLELTSNSPAKAGER
jgi:hypothetical protein